MDRLLIIEELRNDISGFLNTRSIDVVDIIYRYEGRDLVLRILVDKPEGGISLDECAYLNKELGRVLDEKDILQGRYILEVSSPGLDRPLKTRNDFLRCMNRKAKVFLKEQINGKFELDGVVGRITDEAVFIDTQDGTVEVNFSKITKAKQIINNF